MTVFGDAWHCVELKRRAAALGWSGYSFNFQGCTVYLRGYGASRWMFMIEVV